MLSTAEIAQIDQGPAWSRKHVRNSVGIGDSLAVGRMWEGEETQGRVISAGMPRSWRRERASTDEERRD